MAERRTIKTDYLARVEGEGAMSVRLRDGEVEHVELRIFEPPRFFEALLRGRSFLEAPDITARICGICPVAYQMSAVQAMEDACGVEVPEPIQALRRLLYCGEWIESHALHVYMLHAPDFLGYDGRGRARARRARGGRARARAEEDRQRADDRSSAGARSTRSTSASAASTGRRRSRELRTLVEPLERAREAALETVRWTAGFDFPERAVDCELVALSQRRTTYAIERGRIASDRGPRHRGRRVRRALRRGARRALERAPLAAARRRHVPLRAARALRARTATGSRRSRSRRRARPALEPPCRDPFRSIVVRSVELVYACDEALRLIDGYEEPDAPFVAVEPRRRDRLRRDRGAARPALPPLPDRRRRARSSTRRSSRRPRRTSSRSRTTCAASSSRYARSAGRRAARALRADDPQLRPLHLVRDALPRPRGRAAVRRSSSSASATPTAATTAPGWRSRERLRERVLPERRGASTCEQEPIAAARRLGRARTSRSSSTRSRRAPPPGRCTASTRRERPVPAHASSAARRTRSASATRSSSRARSAGCPTACSSTAIEGERFAAGAELTPDRSRRQSSALASRARRGGAMHERALMRDLMARIDASSPRRGRDTGDAGRRPARRALPLHARPLPGALRGRLAWNRRGRGARRRDARRTTSPTPARRDVVARERGGRGLMCLGAIARLVETWDEDGARLGRLDDGVGRLARLRPRGARPATTLSSTSASRSRCSTPPTAEEALALDDRRRSR